MFKVLVFSFVALAVCVTAAIPPYSVQKSVKFDEGNIVVSAGNVPTNFILYKLKDIETDSVSIEGEDVPTPFGGISFKGKNAPAGSLVYEITFAPNDQSLCQLPHDVVLEVDLQPTIVTNSVQFPITGNFCFFTISLENNGFADQVLGGKKVQFKLYLAAKDNGDNGVDNVDVAILNFALNLEYLEAEFYLAAVGKVPVYESQVTGKVTGGSKVTFATPELEEYAKEIARDEENHVVFLRAALGNKAVDRPDIDIAGGPEGAFGIAASAAGATAGLDSQTQKALATFSPYANEVFFLHGAFIFEDVGVTAYKGASPLVTNKAFLEAAAGILAVEAYHASSVRTLLYQLRDAVAVPAKAFKRSKELLVADVVGAISELRDVLDGPEDLDQSIILNGKVNLVPTDSNSIAFSRSPRQVLNIVYGAVGASKGLFFPKGVNGDFSALL